MIGLFVDSQNLYRCAQKKFGNARIDYTKFSNFIDSKIPDLGNNELMSFAYVIRADANADKFIDFLKILGYSPVIREPRSVEKDGEKHLKIIDWSVGISADVFRLIDKLSSVIVCSSNPVFADLFQFLKERRIKTYCVGVGIPQEIKMVVDRWHEIPEEILKGEAVA